MNSKLSPKGIILDLCSQRSRLIKYSKGESRFKEIIEFITEKDYYNDDDLQIPSVKDISDKTGITYSKLSRDLKKLYTLLMDYDVLERVPFEVSQTVVIFYVKGYQSSARINITGLVNLPRQGERISIPYFKEYLETDFFHVASVHHEFHDSIHEVCIWLDTGFYNSYWQLRKDQAFETGELRIYDLSKSDSELKKILKIRPGNAW